MGHDVTVTIIGIATVITAVLSLVVLLLAVVAWIKGWFHVIKSSGNAAKRLSAFMEHILPSMLEGFEKQKFIPSGTLSKWTEVISSSNYSAHSLKQLNERGRNLLERSGMKEIVDTQFDQLSEKLVERGWKSLNEIESQAFYVLKELENEDSAVPIKDYL